MTDEREPEVSIVMPVRNEARSLDQTLDDVLAQELDGDFEIVVVDGRSTDGTLELLERRSAAEPRIRIVDNPAGGTPQALNAGLRAARGELIVRVDGHSRLPPDYVRTIVDHMRSGRCDGAGGIKRPVGTSAFGRAVAAVWASKFGIGDSPNRGTPQPRFVDHIPFGAYRRGLALGIGGWDETFVRNQDAEFDYRYTAAGGRLLLDPAIVVDWRVRETPARLARQYYEYGYWRLRTLLKHPSRFHWRWAVPPALVLTLVLSAAFVWTWPGRLVLAVSAGAYVLFLAAAAVVLAREVGFRLLPQLMLAQAVIHLAWGTGLLVSAVNRVLRRR